MATTATTRSATINGFGTQPLMKSQKLLGPLKIALVSKTKLKVGFEK
jgi:hypothetical protein